MNKLLGLSVLSVALLLSACAATSTKNSAANLVVEEKITINAPAAKVWEKVANYGNLGAFHPAVAKAGRIISLRLFRTY